MKTLKIFILLCAIGLLPFEGASQQILNGGFEETYTDSYGPMDYLRPLNWYFATTANLMCPTPIRGEMTNDSHTGEWAVKLETLYCGPHESGGVGTGQENESSVFPDIAHAVDARPDQVSYYYKFSPANGDTALFSAVLFNYPDSITVWQPDWFLFIDTVGIAQELIIEPENEYVERVVNFEYLSTETPKYIIMYFSTYHNIFNFYEGEYADPGTTLWIDDIELIYLTTSSENLLQETQVRIYPNPVADHFQVEVPANITVQSMQVHDFSGRHVKTLNPQNQFFSLNELPAGMYFLTVHTDQGSVVKKLVKE